MYLLVRTPSPLPTESMFGFVLRVSEANGYETPWYILRMAGLRQDQMRMTGFSLDRLAAVLGRPAEDLLHIANRVGDKNSFHFTILGHNLGKSLMETTLRKKNLALCPHCVGEVGYIDALWDLDFVVACPKHQCEVLRVCPDCGKKLRLFRPGLLTCQCGASLSKVSLVQVSQGLGELMGLIQAKLHNRSLYSVPNKTRYPIEVLELIPFREFMRILRAMGERQLMSHGINEVKEPLLVARATVDALGDWPNGYHQMLKRIGERAISEKMNAGGLGKQFESFCQAIFKNKVFGKDTAFLKQEFINFGLTVWGNATVDPKLFKDLEVRFEHRFVSMSTLARQHRLWHPTIKRMIADGTLVTKTVTAGKICRVVIDMERSYLPAASVGIVTDREAAAMVGIPVSVLKHLRDAGLFETKARLHYESSWYAEDVEAFLKKVCDLAPEIEVLPDGAVFLRDVMRLKFGDKVAKADIAVAMFDGRLKAVGRHGCDMGCLALWHTHVAEFAARKRVEVNGNGYSIGAAARQTGLDNKSIAHAIEVGLLSSFRCNGRERVSVESVERFNAQYMPLTIVAKKLGTLAQHLMRKCQKQGIPLLFLERSGRGSAQPVLRRKDEPGLLRTITGSDIG